MQTSARKYIAHFTAALLGCCAITAAQAGVIVSNGVTWELTSNAAPGAASGTFKLEATTLNAWDQGGTAWLASFSLKNFGTAVQVNGGNPGGVTATGGIFDWTNEDLNANGCKEVGTDDALCIYLASALPGNGNLDVSTLGNPTTPNTGMSSFSFEFDVAAINGTFPDMLHFKVNWWGETCKTKKGVQTCEWKKVGDLISQDIAYQPKDPDPDPDPDPVPVPGTLLLLGLGLALLRKAHLARR